MNSPDKEEEKQSFDSSDELYGQTNRKEHEQNETSNFFLNNSQKPFIKEPNSIPMITITQPSSYRNKESSKIKILING